MGTTKKDYSHDVKLLKSRFLRHVLMFLGTIFFITGLLGIFLPVLPTTPFLLLSALCYSKASVRFYNWLLNNRIVGSYIRSWKEHGSLPIRVKITSISLIILTIGSSIILWIPNLILKTLTGLIGIAVIVYILRIPTRKE